MRKTCVRLSVLAGVWLWMAGSAPASYIDHHFDAAPFTNGAGFLSAVSNWHAELPTVAVVNTKSYSSPQSVYLPAGGAISNAVAQGSPTIVWTDMRIAPFRGVAPTVLSTNGVSAFAYVNTNGYLTLRSGTDWLICSNDVWNAPVAPLTNGVFATISICQNFGARRTAVLVNDRVVAQDIPFLAAAITYDFVSVRSPDGNSWLDDAYVQSTYDPVRLVSNQNGVDGVDASELQTYGYVARTLDVGTGPYAFASLTDALAVARDRDTLSVDCGTLYADTVTVTQNLTITGCAFTNSGTLSVAAGKTMTVATGFTSSLNVLGSLALSQGVVVSGATVAVAGTVTVSTNNAQLLAGDLDITGSGTVVATGGRVADANAGTDLTGTFNLTSTWNTPAVASLDFNDDFERYGANSRMQGLGAFGWGASTTGVLVKSSEGYASAKAVVVPGGSLLSNRIATVQTKIWTDFYLKPVPGNAPSSLNTSATAFISYVATNGMFNVWSAGAWLACTNYAGGSAVAAMTSNAFRRVTVFANFDSDLAAVFVDGKLAREGVAFPAGAGIPGYGSFRTLNGRDNAYLDNVRITASTPPDLIDDQDGDDVVDAQEIQAYDSVFSHGNPRTVITFH